MNVEGEPASLVARFLRNNGYPETLDTFLKEANLPPDTGSQVKDALTIEQIMQEKRLFDVSRTLEKLGVEEEDAGWHLPAPSVSSLIDTLPGQANILHVSLESINPDLNSVSTSHALLATAADKTTNFVSINLPHSPVACRTPATDSPILDAIVLQNQYLLTASMSGKLVLSSLRTGEIIAERRDHQKYVVKIATYTDESSGAIWVATAAWDAKVRLYQITGLDPHHTRDVESALSVPLATLSLPTNPECILFITHPEIASPVLLLSRRDSTYLYYYAITNGSSTITPSSPTKTDFTFQLLGRQNLTPHSNAWVAFTPSSFAPSPRDPHLLAVATSSVPHMKLLIVRLLLPPPPQTQTQSLESGTSTLPFLASTEAEPTTTTSNSASFIPARARAELALQDREAATIVIQVSTLAPQTPYSTPTLAWRPDGTGVWVNGDDGAVRGVEASTGKIVVTLVGGHEAGSKVRCLAAGWVTGEGANGENGDGKKEECLVSGGFDRRLVVWKVGDNKV